MTVEALLTSMSSYEMEEWKAFFRVRNKRKEHDRLIEKATAGVTKRKPKVINRAKG